METVIVICLIIIIILLVKDKLVINCVKKTRKTESKIPDLSEIMGKAKPVVRQLVPNKANRSQLVRPHDKPGNFEEETSETGFAREIPPEELDEIFGSTPDQYEEEEEWNDLGLPNSDDGFATGVTYAELKTAEKLLRRNVLEPASAKQAVEIVQRLQGTELFSLLENSIQGASHKIAELLDKKFPAEMDSSSSLRKKGLEDFDIGEFV